MARRILGEVGILLAGCSAQTFAPGTGPELVVARKGAPFYQNGPGQFSPPEERLDAGERVRMLCREFGYSRVQLASGRAGYMANEDLFSGEPARGRSSRARASRPDLGLQPPDAPPGG